MSNYEHLVTRIYQLKEIEKPDNYKFTAESMDGRVVIGCRTLPGADEYYMSAIAINQGDNLEDVLNRLVEMIESKRNK